MSERKDFSIDLGDLKRRPKSAVTATVAEIDKAGERHGFVEREPRRRGGRPPSPRTGQVHAKVFPHVQAQIAAEARNRGTQQGVLIEEAWTLYCEKHGIVDNS